MKTFWEQICAWIIALWNSLFHRASQLKPAERPKPLRLYHAIHIENDDDIPKQLSSHTVYIVGVPGNEWLAQMICPCGCGETLFLNLLKEEMPNWQWRVSPDGIVTLSPSVWRTVRCRSHFFLREGRIQWCVS